MASAIDKFAGRMAARERAEKNSSAIARIGGGRFKRNPKCSFLGSSRIGLTFRTAM
jgi:hypothetical protein